MEFDISGLKKSFLNGLCLKNTAGILTFVELQSSFGMLQLVLPRLDEKNNNNEIKS